MKIIVNESYQISTPESIEIGEFADQGIIEEHAEYSLEELKDYLESKDFIEPSDSLITRTSSITSSVIENRDFYEKGTQETRTLHLVSIQNDDGSSIKDDVADKVWRKILLEASGRNHNLDGSELSL